MQPLTWTISPDRSLITFHLKYLDLSRLSGRVQRFNGMVITHEFFDNPEIYLFLDVDSIETHQNEENALLKSRDILYLEQFPFIEFSSVSGCLLRSGSIWELTGNLMIKDIKEPFTLIVNYSDIKWNAKEGLAKFRLFGEFSRSAFGLGCSGEDAYGDIVFVHADIVLQAMIA